MKSILTKIKTEDNLILQGLFYEPDGDSKGVILHIHGMAGNFYENKFLDVMAQQLTNNGWSFLTVNNRGHDYISEILIEGKKEEFKRIGNAYEIFEECVLDINAWIDWLENKGFKNIVLEGHSLGAPKVAYYSALTQDIRINKLILMSPADMVGLAEAEDYHNDLYAEAKSLVEQGDGKNILSRQLWDDYFLSANTYIDFFTRDNPIDIINTYEKEKPSLLSEINIPILALFGEKDDATIYPPAEVLDIIKSKTTNAKQFDTAMISNAPHSYFGGEDEMVGKIIKWLG